VSHHQPHVVDLSRPRILKARLGLRVNAMSKRLSAEFECEQANECEFSQDCGKLKAILHSTSVSSVFVRSACFDCACVTVILVQLTYTILT
jgi:hypothetical protein